jgi:hypothetical protein
MVGPFPNELLAKKHPGWRIIRGDLFTRVRGWRTWISGDRPEQQVAALAPTLTTRF